MKLGIYKIFFLATVISPLAIAQKVTIPTIANPNLTVPNNAANGDYVVNLIQVKDGQTIIYVRDAHISRGASISATSTVDAKTNKLASLEFNFSNLKSGTVKIEIKNADGEIFNQNISSDSFIEISSETMAQEEGGDLKLLVEKLEFSNPGPVATPSNHN